LQGNAPSKIFEAQNEIYFNKIFSPVSVTVNGSLFTGLLVLLELTNPDLGQFSKCTQQQYIVT